MFGGGQQQSLFGGGAPQQSSLFGAPSGGLSLGPSQQQQQQQGGGLFGSGGGSGSLFGGSQQRSPGTSLFGGASQQQQQPLGSSLFGGGAPQQQQSGTSLFGAPQQQQQQGSSLFGAPQQQGSSLFGAPQQQTASSLFGGGGSLFGGGGGGSQSSLLGGSNSGGSLLFGNQTLGQPQQQQQQFMGGKPIINYKQYALCGFAGAYNLTQFADAPELKMGSLPSGREATPQAYLSAGLVPEPLRTELIEQQAEIDGQDSLLNEAMAEAPSDLNRLLALTSQMDLSVQALRNSLARQRQAVELLVEEAKVSGRACERGISDARRINKPAFTVDKPVPSDFFWLLLQRLERTLVEYQLRCAELKQAVGSLSKPNPNATLADVVDLSKQQHRAFKLVSQNLATVHRQADALRAKYVEHVRATKGETPSFDEDDKRERERNRRMLRKVEEQAKVQMARMNQPKLQTLAQQQAASPQGVVAMPLALGAPPTPAAPGSFQQATSGGGLFGSQAPGSATGSGGGGLFGGGGSTSGGATGFGSTPGGGASAGGLFSGQAGGGPTQGGLTAIPGGSLFAGGGSASAPSSGVFGGFGGPGDAFTPDMQRSSSLGVNNNNNNKSANNKRSSVGTKQKR